MLLTTIALVLVLASGTAMAEVRNGPIYYGNNGILSVDSTVSNPQPSVVTDQGNLFDISRDRTTLVYQWSYFSNDDPGPFYTVPLSGAPYYDANGAQEVKITNLSASMKEMTEPRFSPDGKTIYFIGVHVVDPPEGTDPRPYDVPAIYSVPTEGGQATKVPINWVNDDGSPGAIGSFAVSHDGSKFAINGPYGIFTVPVSGGVPTRVNRDACGGAQYPSFSPDDQTIVYTSYIWSGDNCSGAAERTLYTTPANNDGTSPGTPLFPEDATDPNIYDSKRWPTYSPDGQHIAFTNWLGGGPDYLATVPATGGPIKNIASCVFCVPLWIEKSPDPPDTAIDSGPSGTVRSTTASFAFSSSQSDATFECKLDNGAFAACTSPKSYPGPLSQGSHTFEVRAVNSAGSVDPTPASRSWFVDTVVPKGTISINGGAYSTSSRYVTLRLSASDPSPGSGVAYMRFRNGGTTTWSSWFAYSTSKSWTLTSGAGTKTVYAQYRDRAGNVSAAAYDTIRYSP